VPSSCGALQTSVQLLFLRALICYTIFSSCCVSFWRLHAPTNVAVPVIRYPPRPLRTHSTHSRFGSQFYTVISGDVHWIIPYSCRPAIRYPYAGWRYAAPQRMRALFPLPPFVLPHRSRQPPAHSLYVPHSALLRRCTKVRAILDVVTPRP